MRIGQQAVFFELIGLRYGTILKGQSVSRPCLDTNASSCEVLNHPSKCAFFAAFAFFPYFAFFFAGYFTWRKLPSSDPDEESDRTVRLRCPVPFAVSPSLAVLFLLVFLLLSSSVKSITS